ncbi:hypothetical protein KIN20_005103 [Parelaphostrongylus tenuis]|uniref:Uncharacterized protein n=1 Tax=Parelaphostrongylus tenuis TaxID=148309 RepID=A0AAD5MHV9_PARTN|nr:hypothetical protein KIN20_005103 [Parelaphostrongylus tenuis]
MNMKGLLKEVMEGKLNGVMVQRFKNSRDVTVLSTAHYATENPCANKFEVVEMYNRRKSLVDQSDQIAAISPT